MTIKKPIEELMPEIITYLLLWKYPSQMKSWLASLVMGIVQERARSYKLCDMAAMKDRLDVEYISEKEQQALRDFNMTLFNYEEIKKRVAK